MKINFPRGIVIDTDNIPAHFDAMIRDAFKGYTEGTAPAYMYQDKLAFIDACAVCLHGGKDSSEAVNGLIKESVSWQLDEYGQLPDKGDFLSVDFMCDCYRLGEKNAQLYDHYTGRHHTDDKIMELLYRAIKVVVDYEEDAG